MAVETVPAWFYRQSGVIPVRRVGGRVEVLLVTSRGGKRWIVPKGVIERDLTPAQSAAKEAWEEAGVRGTLCPRSIGTYQYEKWGGTCTVEVFLMAVEETADEWPEPHRLRRWVGVDEAAEALAEPDLRALVRSVPEVLAGEEGGR
jgi:phosphohistidine phosphatase